MKIIRTITAYICAPVIAVTGKGFSSYHRHHDTLTYLMVDTIGANILAGKMRTRFAAKKGE